MGVVSRELFGVDRRWWGLVFVAPLVVALFLSVGSGVARASGTLDQSQTTFDTAALIAGPGGPPASEAQTFTAGLTGGLDRVDLLLNNTGASAPLTVQIRNTSGGAPGSSVLASASVPAASVPSSAGFVEVDFASPAPVKSGTQYAIVAYTADTSSLVYEWALSTLNPYSRGAQWVSFASPPTTWTEISSDDFAFKTYVVKSQDGNSQGQNGNGQGQDG